MTPDPIVDEVRAARDAFAKAHGYDVDQILQALQAQPLPTGARVVSLPPKRIPKSVSAQKPA